MSETAAPSPDAGLASPGANEQGGASGGSPKSGEPRSASAQSLGGADPEFESSSGAAEGTGEGPPPGTRLEAIIVSIIALGMVILPSLASLRRISDALAHSSHLKWLTHSVGAVLSFLTPSDVSWISVYVQNGTLWLGLLGAVLATAGGKHLGLATTNFMPRGRLRRAAEIFSTVSFAMVALVLAYASARMVAVDRSSGDSDLLPGGLHKWVAELIMPIAFALMAVRVVLRATDPGIRLDAPHGPSSSSDHIMPADELVKVQTPLRRAARWGWRILAVALAVLAVYIGMRYDQSARIQAVIGRLDHWHGSIRLIVLAAMGVGFLLGTPVFVAMAGVAMALFFASDTPVAALPTETFRLVVNPSLPAIPLLTIAGYVLASGRSSQRMVRAYKSVFGWMPGGMAVMVVFVCALFTTFTGASGVTILALGGLVYPMLIKDQYPKGFSLGLVTAAGSLGLLFPPSLPVLLYSVAASAPGSAAPVSVEQLFIGGLIPGLVLVFLVSLYGIHQGMRVGAPRQPFPFGNTLRAIRDMPKQNGRVEAILSVIRPGWSELKQVFAPMWAAKWDLLLPVVVMATFLSGLATVVEAAAIGATYALLVELLIYRDVHPFRALPGVLVHAAALVGAVVVLLGVALGLTNYLVLAEVPTALVDWVRSHIQSQWVFLFVLNIMLLVLGSVLEIYSAIVVLVPLVAPLGVAFNVHPVHLGVIFLANLELGFLCPPMGLNLFLSATRFQKPLPVLYRQALPFLLIMSIGVLFITYFEVATMGLLRLLGKQ